MMEIPHHSFWNLPPPSQLHLQDNALGSSNTLPPINQQQQQQEHWDSTTIIKSESMQSSGNDGSSSSFPNTDDPMPATSDFVKKLYKMLEDSSFQQVVSWGPQGDCFVVKDMNEFTKSILPRMFKHSNFASFVRQLNKYDFHKVKNTDDNQFGEHSWTFRHPDFHANRKDALENIKRKVPASRKTHTVTSSSTTTRPLSPPSHYSSHHLHSSPYPTPNCVQTQVHVDSLQSEIRRLREEGDDMRTRLRTLERNYENVLLELVSFQRGMAQQDGVMQNLIGYFMGSENGKSRAAEILSAAQQSGRRSSSQPPSQSQQQPAPSQPPPQPSQPSSAYVNPPSSSASTSSVPDHPNPFLAYPAAQRILRQYSAENTDVARATLLQMNELSRRAEDIGFIYDDAPAEGGSRVPVSSLGRNDDILPDEEEQERGQKRSGSSAPSMESRMQTMATSNSRNNDDSNVKRDQSRPPSRIWQAAMNAGLFNNLGLFAGNGGRQDAQDGRDGRDMEERENNNGNAWVAAQGIGTSAVDRNAGSSNGTWGGPSSDVEDSHPVLAHEGLQVYTVGHLLPRGTLDNGAWNMDPAAMGIPFLGQPQAQSQAQQRSQEFIYPREVSNDGSEDAEDEEVVRPTLQSGSSSSNPSASDPGPSTKLASTSSSSTRKLRVRRSTFVPGWAVPPRVLLVDDDAVTRKLSSKFLQVFGCTIDVAVDGVGAVNKMNLEKYDLVLMDIVMPKLDGMSATSLIRKFDCMTPIISMTSNSKPDDILNYFSSGMNDILPKPFTKQGMLDMLEKHLTHLRAIQQMSRIPRSLVVSNGEGGNEDDGSYGQNLSSSEMLPTNQDDGRINPIAGLGLTDEQYNMIVQDIVNTDTFGVGIDDGSRMGGSSRSGMMTGGMGMMGVTMLGMGEKRSLEDPSEGREGKRSRFEVIE